MSPEDHVLRRLQAYGLQSDARDPSTTRPSCRRVPRGHPPRLGDRRGTRASGIGGQVAGGISDLICRIGGGDCAAKQAGPSSSDTRRSADLARREQALAGLGGAGEGYQSLLDRARAARERGNLDEAQRLVEQLELYRFLAQNDRGDLMDALNGPSDSAFRDLVDQETIDEAGGRNRRYFTVPPSPGDGVVAMDFFIPDESSGTLLKGDGRDTVDPLLGDAPLDESRIVIVIDRETGRGVITQSPTCIASRVSICQDPRPIVLGDRQRRPQVLPDDPNEFDVEGGDGTLKLSYDGLNSITPGAISVDGTVEFKRGSDGAYDKTEDSRDPYPRIVTGQYRPGQPGGIIDETDDRPVFRGAPPRPVRDVVEGACSLPGILFPGGPAAKGLAC